MDVTLGTDQGVYLYVESSAPAANGDKAILISPYIDPPALKSCFSVFYFMYGEDVNEFNVYTNDSFSNVKKLYSIKGNQGFKWSQLQLEITSDIEFKIILEGVVGRGSRGDIAIVN